MYETIREGIYNQVFNDPEMQKELEHHEKAISEGRMTSFMAASSILNKYKSRKNSLALTLIRINSCIIALKLLNLYSMRKLMIILLAIIAIQSCNQTEEGYNIQVNLEDAEGKWVKLMALEDRTYVIYDSVFAEPGTPAVMSGSMEGVQPCISPWKMSRAPSSSWWKMPIMTYPEPLKIRSYIQTEKRRVT